MITAKAYIHLQIRPRIGSVSACLDKPLAKGWYQFSEFPYKILVDTVKNKEYLLDQSWDVKLGATGPLFYDTSKPDQCADRPPKPARHFKMTAEWEAAVAKFEQRAETKEEETIR
jgi:hypothetical protein